MGDTLDVASVSSAGKVGGIFHPVIGVSRMSEALPFYRDILGLRVTFDDYHDPAAISHLFGFSEPIVHSVVLECPDRSEIELIEYERPLGRPSDGRKMNDAGIVALALRVTDVSAFVHRIDAGGYAMPAGLVEQILPDGAVLQVLVVRGPDAVTVILVEPPEGRRSLAAG